VRGPSGGPSSRVRPSSRSIARSLGEKVARRQLRLELDDAVQELRLVDVADRVGLAQRRDADDADL